MGAFVNSNQVQFNRSNISCGVLEAHHLTAAGGRRNAYQIATALYHKANPRPASFVIFSDVISKTPGRGQELAEFLNTIKGGGQLICSGTQVNPRTGNPIAMWILCPNHDAFRAWYTEETMHRIEE